MRAAVIAAALLLVSGSADAGRPPRFSATLEVDASWKARVTVKNTTGNPIQLVSHLDASGERHYDSLWIELTFPSPSREGCTGRYAGKTTRQLRFKDKRKRSTPVVVELAPDQTITHEIDLRAWAARPINRKLALGRGFFKARAGWTREGATAVSHQVRLTIDNPALPMTPKACEQNPGWDRF